MSLDSHWSVTLLSLAWISVKQSVIHFFHLRTLQFMASCLPCYMEVQDFQPPLLFYQSKLFCWIDPPKNTYFWSITVLSWREASRMCQQSLFLLICRCTLFQQVFALTEVGFCWSPSPLYLVLLLRIWLCTFARQWGAASCLPPSY